jgi:mevalonyl-CoA ligase
VKSEDGEGNDRWKPRSRKRIKPYLAHSYYAVLVVYLTNLQVAEKLARAPAGWEAIVIPWTGARWTYKRLWNESSMLARALLKYGVRPRDRIGIMSGNCEKYIAVFFACARVGAICVTLNNTYTPTEMEYALKHTSQ